jgi:hypothetical protein
MADRDKEDRAVKVIAAAIVALLLVVVLGLSFAVRVYAPCWMFPLREAPVRCLPGQR